MYKIYRQAKELGIGFAHYVTDDDGAVMVFHSEQDAQDYINEEGLDESDYFYSFILEVE